MRFVVILLVVVVAACVPGTPSVQVQGSREGEGEEGEGEGGEGEGEEGEGETGTCEENKPGLGGGAVFFGTREPSHVVLTAAEKRAIVGVGTGRPPGSECSGTLITDDVVLTALHCTEGVGATNFYITIGVDDFDPELVVDVVEKAEHPQLDMTLLRLEFAPSSQIDITPIPAFGGTLRESEAGEIFEQAGFGQTETGDSNGRLFVAEPFDSFEEPGGYLVVNGEDQHGVCFGDSGGPSLRQTDTGVRVMGALSYGDPSCTGFDRYTRVDLAQDFIEDFAGPIPTGEPVPCGAVTTTGSCSPDQRVATFCGTDGFLVRDTCGAGTVCGDDADGKRCIDVAAAPCGDVTAFGACDGERLTWCDGGEVKTRDCDLCGGDNVCNLVDNVTGFACIEDPCGDLTFTGRCDGNVAVWCEDHAIQTQDCSEDSETCGFVDADTGFFCQ